MMPASTFRPRIKRVFLCCLLLLCACSLSSCTVGNPLATIIKQVLKLPYNIVRTVI